MIMNADIMTFKAKYIESLNKGNSVCYILLVAVIKVSIRSLLAS